MSYPSIETIAWELTYEKCGHTDCTIEDPSGSIARACRKSVGVKRIPPVRAIAIRKILDGSHDPYEPITIEGTEYGRKNPFQAHATWQAQMDLLDTILETCGVEHLDYDCRDSEYRDDVGPLGFAYCNTGDTYAATIVRCHETKRYLVASWGDMVERHEKRCSICKRINRENAA